MKKELAAVFLLFLLALGAWLNIRHIDNLIDSVDACLDRSQSAAAREDAQEALSALSGALDHWQDGLHYTGIFLSHRNGDSVSDAFGDVEELLRQEDFAAAPAAYSRLRYYLEQIRFLERLSLESVL